MVVGTISRLSFSTPSAAAHGLLRLSGKPSSSPPPVTLGILAFDAAKIMSRLISLYRSLTKDEMDRLRKNILRSEGVAYLNSRDEAYLLSHAWAERLEALDGVAEAVRILGRWSSDVGLNRFDLVYADLKLGLIDIGRLEFASRRGDKIVEKMEKLTSATAGLYSALETLAEMEASERKLQQWRGMAACQGQSGKQAYSSLQKANCELFERNIASQRKLVRRYKDASLWSRTVDKCVALMARTVCVVFMRICIVFGPFLADLPGMPNNNVRFYKQSPQVAGEMEKMTAVTNSGPIPMSENKSGLAKFYSRKLKMSLFVPEDMCILSGAGRKSCPATVFNSAPETTVGEAGLSQLYANVIILAEGFLKTSAENVREEARSSLYEMLPARLRIKVRSKMRRSNIMGDGEGYCSDDMYDDDYEDDVEDSSSCRSQQAEGWREAVERMMGWLAPVAHDTVMWQSERTMEKQRFESKLTVLLVQTLHYSDLEKTEAAIVEVLVGLSCIFRYEKRRRLGCGGRKIH
ncbi:hypothetical protein SAY87_014830 [Trapa incisa]|uniref:Uncharacterized protein n=1 Tax=Trapa incisa TaxID=236973 RepID=A0AAN7H0B9_9MYRT|nr:hypothetical protein SAY87_014830 [Trapa incisa]